MCDARQEWTNRLRALARDGDAPPKAGIGDARAFVAEFSDEMGHRRNTDAFLLTGVLRRRGHDIPPPKVQDDDSVVPALWRCALIGAGAPGMTERGPWTSVLSPAPPMLARDAFGTIEVWSECLLSALHALSWIVRVDDRTSGRAGSSVWNRDRLWREARWIIEHLEPDNATRHPWGVHVFIELFMRGGDREAGLYVDELLHVCRVSLGRPDRLSAWILLDAADCLSEG